MMDLGRIGAGMKLAGAVIGTGAIIGGGAGAVRALRSVPDADASGVTRMERRSVAADAVIGGLAGAVTGVAMIGGKRFVAVTALKALSPGMMLGLGAATGAAAYGAHSLARVSLN